MSIVDNNILSILLKTVVHDLSIVYVMWKIFLNKVTAQLAVDLTWRVSIQLWWIQRIIGRVRIRGRLGHWLTVDMSIARGCPCEEMGPHVCLTKGSRLSSQCPTYPLIETELKVMGIWSSDSLHMVYFHEIEWETETESVGRFIFCIVLISSTFISPLFPHRAIECK